jgi:hypothetical protein
VLLALGLIALSAIVYLVHYAIFRDAHHIVIYLIGDIAFVPAEVLLVTIVLHQLLEGREKRAMLKKLNMVIGAFFSEVGTEMMERFISFDSNFDKVRSNLLIKPDWAQGDFRRVKKNLHDYDYSISCTSGDLKGLRDFLTGKRIFLLRLLENPVLLEHDDFTDLLWAVFHLTEELISRVDLDACPESDRDHLSGDMKRAYILLLREWVDYMNHLRVDYPYLYSLAVRTNPFDPEASVEVVQP